MSVTTEATQSFARVGFDVLTEMTAPASPEAEIESTAPVADTQAMYVFVDDCPTTAISHELPLLTHVGELPAEDQLPVASHVSPTEAALLKSDTLPQIKEEVFEEFWRPTELGFAAMSSLAGWGEFAAFDMAIDHDQAITQLREANEAVRAMSLRHLYPDETSYAKTLDAQSARLALRALRYEHANARAEDDDPRARTAAAAQRWIVSRVTL